MFSRLSVARAIARAPAATSQAFQPTRITTSRFFSSTPCALSSKVYVGGLEWGIEDLDLQAKFESYGTLTNAYVVKDKESRRSRGFGFVEYAEDDAAAKAIEALNETELAGRILLVKMAIQQESGQRTGGSFGGGYGGGDRRGGYGQGRGGFDGGRGGYDNGRRGRDGGGFSRGPRRDGGGYGRGGGNGYGNDGPSYPGGESSF
ncbi:hypothetical protein F5Y15DRAFT_137239 [Xylariaceae sp. FL0016]|nr:hypothetical protein F5Y15DRAFT_137239 [Xylariaceae sp. FL0016]